MKIGVVKEIRQGERRVALVPEGVARLVKTGHEVLVQSGAGAGARISDEEYAGAGAQVTDGPDTVYAGADLLPKVRAPIENEETGTHEVRMIREGSVLVSFLSPHEDRDLLDRLAERRITAFSLNLLPRISRAQGMDALSSQATIVGYKAVLLGANTLGRFFPMLTTAAGTIPPARVFVLGAGVAGLQAIATSRRLGAVVEAFDIRPVAREEVESLGARFVGVGFEVADAQDAGGYAKAVTEETKAKEQEVIGRHVASADVVITTALVPGRPAPRLVTGEMVTSMRAGSVIVDLAAEAGGNCELTERGRTVVHRGVTILGPVDLPSEVPFHASQMYSRNISAFIAGLLREGQVHLDFGDEVVRATCLTHGGEVLVGER